MKSVPDDKAAARFNPRFAGALLFLLLVVVLSLLFAQSFTSNMALFANDGPLAAQKARMYDTPSAFFGIWNNLQWIGLYSGNFMPNSTGFLRWFLGPHGYINFFAPISLLMLGLVAAFFFRQMRFGALAIILGGLAAALNSNFFSNACWGLPTRATSLAFTFLALAAVHSSYHSNKAWKFWAKSVLAGLAVGMSISEGADNGAIFSIFVGTYAFFLGLIQTTRPMASRAGRGVAQVAVMVVLAAIMAAQTLNIFTETSVKGIVGTEQTTETREAQWDKATQWSLPKIETLRLIIPGLYGYRMDTEDGGQYWGRVGEFAGNPQAFPRYSGAGEYAGVLVVLVAVWALAASFRRSEKTQAFTDQERKTVWFWGAMALVAMGLGWGRHAPFYQIVYALPYFSTIRNPMKFFHPLHMILMILFAYGVQGLTRLYLEDARNGMESLGTQIKAWWAKANPFEKKWTYGSVGAVLLGALIFAIYANNKPAVIQKLKASGLQPNAGEDLNTLAGSVASFSIHEVGMFVLFLAVSVAVLILVQSGALAGRKSVWAGILLGTILVVDMARANAPWIVYFDWQKRYASNPIVDVLKEEPHTGRMTMPRFNLGQQFGLYQQIYNVEWLQHLFQFYNVQSLDIAQEPRMPEEKVAYLTALSSNIGRLWELTNTRWVGGMADSVQLFNQQLDPGKQRFQIHTLFNFFRKPDSDVIGVETNAAAGPYALIEFTGALPRAKLYGQWQVETHGQAVLDTLKDPAFNPHQSVVLSEPPPATFSPTTTTNEVGSANIVSYAPKRVVVNISSRADGILLLNGKYDPHWEATLDGQPAPLMRANFLMRAVAVPAGDHTVEFHFRPPTTFFWISSSAMALGLVLCLVLFVDGKRGTRAAGS